ncbi:hypothetical protein BCR39DRAFT_334416 [Naematelia encephala]|uniref:Uncharacterized protein n=1 Tax=Naematelia encephala TaxID=71784 RepID=A0A1Y2ANR0_9TREE|nr:hypothetical protein BCR39DRAFT_334416 [Naematelia encephala]
MPRYYLLSKTLDPLLGIFTGLLAYQLHETNPRTAPPEGHTLRELAVWKWGEMRSAKEARERVEEARHAEEWERVKKELEVEGKK